ncbi:MAG: chloride channel protein [Ruminococcaceae bacterium]|nr:chloride channel protein [Oscillospiraceae bacterium]
MTTNVKKKTIEYLKLFVKWLIIIAVIGIIGGFVGSFFHKCLELVTYMREGNSKLILFLPIAGLMITAIYHPFKSKGKLNTNRILEAAETDGNVPLILSPIIFVSTLITHLFGGSAGREGAALQLGGCIGYNLGKLFKLNKSELHTIVMVGMSSFFSAMFGTPLAAAIFALEVVRAKNIHRKSIIPCLLSSAIAYMIARLVGTEGVRFTVETAKITPDILLKAAILAAFCALVSIVFCLAIKWSSVSLKKLFTNDYIRSFAGGVIILLLAYLLKTTDYNGAGMSVIERAMRGEATSMAFVMKIIFTAITIAAGFKGGEIVPTLFIGSTFGCVFGPLIGLDAAFASSLGFIAVFCGVVKCPLASVALAVEVFGGEGILIYTLVCAVSFVLSGKFCIYEHIKLAHMPVNTAK